MIVWASSATVPGKGSDSAASRVDASARNPDNRAEEMVATVRADHERLKLLGQKLFERFDAPHVVTFLNQTLKERQIIFGVRLVDGSYELSVYDATEPADGQPTD